MTPDADLSDRYVAVLGAVLARGERAVSARPLAGGLSNKMFVVDVAVPSGSGGTRQVVLRECNSAFVRSGRETRLLRRLAECGLPVPRLLGEDGTIAMLEFIPGAPSFSVGDGGRHERRRFGDAVADLLALVHGVTAAAVAGFGVPDRVEDVGWHLDNPPDVLDALQEGQIREMLSRWWPPPAVAPHLQHGDVWPGNIIWQDGRIVGLVDWEEPGTGDPLGDLSISRLDLLWMLGPDAMEAVTARYLATAGLSVDGPTVRQRLAMWDLVAALRPAGGLARWAGGWPECGRPDITLATMTADHHRFANAAMSVLDGSARAAGSDQSY